MKRLATALLAFSLVAVGCAGGTPHVRRASPAERASPGGVEVPRFSHVAVIVMENKEYSDIIGKQSAPYINSLAHRFSLATGFFAIRHPSLPNYLALTSGSTWNITSDCTTCHIGGRNLVDDLQSAGITWKAYMEDMPSACFQGDTAGGYRKDHDPFLYYDDVVQDPGRCAKVVPATQLNADLKRGRLPSFVWITPNACHNMHDCGVGEGDRFLSDLVPRLLGALGPHGVLFLIWDEGHTSNGCCEKAAGGQVAAIVAGPASRAGVRSAVPLDHYSILATIEQAWGLPRLADASCPCTGLMDGLLRL